MSTPEELIKRARALEAEAQVLREKALQLDGWSERERRAVECAATALMLGSGEHAQGLWDVLDALLPSEVYRMLDDPSGPEMRTLAGMDEEGEGA